MWGPEQENVLRTKVLLEKLSTGRHLLVDCYSSIRRSAKALVLLDQPKNFLGSDLPSDILSAALTFALQSIEP